MIKAQTAVKGEWEGGRKEGREEERFLERRAHRMYSRSRGKEELTGDLFGTTLWFSTRFCCDTRAKHSPN